MTDPATAPLTGIKVLSVALNLPGPVAVSHLVRLGAAATTVLPPAGDQLESVAKEWYDSLHADQHLVTLDLKQADDRARLDELLDDVDVFVTSSRPSALRRLGIDFATLSATHPRLCQVDIVGYPGETAEQAGHDLTYQAGAGLLSGGTMPRTVTVDLMGAERAATEACAALVARMTAGHGVRREVALSDIASSLAVPVGYGLTMPEGVLGGALPLYAIYAAADGHVALAALEARFIANLLAAFGFADSDLTHDRLAAEFAKRSTKEWEQWAQDHDIPLAAVR